MKKSTPKVALFLDGSRSFDRGVLRGIAQYTAVHRPWAFIRPAAFYQRSPALAKRSAKELARLDLDGVIMNSSPLTTTVMNLGIPAVVIPVDRLFSGVCHLIADNRGAAEQAADHLIAQGLRQFAYIGFNKALWSLERQHHFCHRLTQRGWKPTSRMIPLATETNHRSRHEGSVKRWIDSLPKPVGIMACNDEVGRWVSELCRLHDIRIPDDVSLIGADNDELICDLCTPPLSSVTFATERAGYNAAEQLQAMMDDPRSNPQHVTAHVAQVVARQSTDLLTIPDEEVVKALRFIRQNSDRLIQVSDVVESTLLSHRTLHSRFCRAVGHSLVKEVNRQRAAHIAKMLLTTSDSIHKIAHSIGYENDGHMSRFFRREMGMPPREFRLSRREDVE